MFPVMELEVTGSLRKQTPAYLADPKAFGGPFHPTTSENGTFVAEDCNCRRNLHRNQSASSDCPVGGLSPRFSFNIPPTSVLGTNTNLGKRDRKVSSDVLMIYP